MPRVIIVGAGVTGLSAAYHLARKGVNEIVVIDKGPVGDGSSQRAAGIITGLLWTEAGIRVRKRCLELFPQLSRDLTGYQFRQVGCLNLFSPETWQQRTCLLPFYDPLGAPYEILSSSDIAHRWPALHPAPDITGLYDPLGGYSEPSEYIPAMRQHLRELGVEIREYSLASGFLLRNGRVAGVETAQGPIVADVVICTVYSWTNTLLKAIGLALPVKAFVHQRYVTKPLPSPIDLPAVNANPYLGYFRPALSGRLLAGIETPSRPEFRVESLDFHMSAVSAPPDAPVQLRERLLPLLPALASIEWDEEKVGLLTFSIDGEPVLGPVRQFPGLLLGLAFHSGGFAYNPGSGELLAEYASEGKTSIDVSSWSPDRFDPAETREYLASTIRQEDVASRRH